MRAESEPWSGDPEAGIYKETKKGYFVFLRRRFPRPAAEKPAGFFFSLAMHRAA